MPAVIVRPVLQRPESLVLRAPLSKSHALRALAAGVVAGGARIRGLSRPWPRDLERFVAATEILGARLREEGDVLHVERPVGRGGGPVTVDAGDGAAPARFLLAIGSITERAVTVVGGGRLGERPMTPLLSALAALGARVNGGPGLPATVQGPLIGGRSIAVDGHVSSQFLSALLLIAPVIDGGVTFRGIGEQVSKPYVELTRDVMNAFSVSVGEDHVIAADAAYSATTVEVEADWSGATVLLAAAPFLGCPVTVPGLRAGSIQPDRYFAAHLAELGLEVAFTDAGVRVAGNVVRGGTFDLSACPDAAPALAAVGALAPEPVTITNAAHLRHKESDRIAVLVALLRAAGAEAEERSDGLVVRGPIASQAPDAAPVRLEVADDHRMAMAGALLGLRRPVEIDDGDCVAKSFPGFFDGWPR